MKIIRFDNNWHKVKTKEELLEMMKQYEGILSNLMINYLYELIELDYSVIGDYITEEDRRALGQLDIYKEVAIYNIYNRALNIFNKTSKKYGVKTEGNENGLEELNAYVDSFELYRFNYGNGRLNTENIPEGYKTSRIGKIDINRLLADPVIREKECED